MGRLIPAGTGLARYQNIGVQIEGLEPARRESSGRPGRDLERRRRPDAGGCAEDPNSSGADTHGDRPDAREPAASGAG